MQQLLHHLIEERVLRFRQSLGRLREYWMAASMREGGSPRQKMCQSAKRTSPSHCLAYQGVMGLSGRDRQKTLG